VDPNGASPQGSSIIIDGLTYSSTSLVNPPTPFGPLALSVSVPASVRAIPGDHQVQLVTPGYQNPSAPVTLTVRAPQISAVTPDNIPILTAITNATLTVTGANFLSTSVVYADSSPLPTTFVSSSQLTAVVDFTVEGATRRGGTSIAVQNGAPAPSNAKGVAVGGMASNRGTLVRHPLNPSPGEAYSGVLEGGTPLSPLTLISDASNPTPIFPVPNATGDFGLSVRPYNPGTPGWAVLTDSLGLFGSPSGPTLDANGRLELPGFVRPAPPRPSASV
jgi:hypothetical protein